MIEAKYVFATLYKLVIVLPVGFMPIQPGGAAELPEVPGGLRVYWVGHSLMESRVATSIGKVRLLELVGHFAESQRLGYSFADHTLWGAPLSLQWRGRPHAYDRFAPDREELRKRFERDAASYDAIVLTETIPVSSGMKHEYTPYYLRRFYCALLSANQKGRVYLYESWLNLQGGSQKLTGKLGLDDWHRKIRDERSVWNQLAADASAGPIREPDLLSRIAALWQRKKQGCVSKAPIHIIPVATAMAELHTKLASNTSDATFLLPDGSKLKIEDLFANPYIDGSPAPKLLHSDRDHDDIHPSAIGVYFSALVTYATLYRRNPTGLPAIDEVGEGLARDLQNVVWTVIPKDPYTGVSE
jgi:hypothetical protein